MYIMGFCRTEGRAVKAYLALTALPSCIIATISLCFVSVETLNRQKKINHVRGKQAALAFDAKSICKRSFSTAQTDMSRYTTALMQLQLHLTKKEKERVQSNVVKLEVGKGR